MIKTTNKKSFDELIKELKDERTDFEKNKQDKIDELESDLSDANHAKDDLIEIDCGVGKIEYVTPENLKLAQLMEEFKSKLELYGVNFMRNKINF
jgi:hypothetical protein